MRKIFLVFFLFPLVIGSAHTAERILNYHSDLVVLTDGSMEVREYIKVRAERKKIRRGIYRDFPTTYKDRLGNRIKVGFELLEVTRDGEAEDFRTENRSNGVRIYIGNKDRYLQAGEYDYMLRYRTNRQLGYFEKHDELYWNVTGNDWNFPIDQASARVFLPEQVPVESIELEAYTGRAGTKGTAYRAGMGSDGHPLIVTTQTLRPSEGLTIVAAWAKGYVYEPTSADRVQFLLSDNAHLVVGLLGLLILLGYYSVAWYRVGKDPEAGIVIPRYVPSKGFSPASMRFIQRMGYDNKTFATALVNLAVKGVLEIVEEKKTFCLIKTDNVETEMAPGEKVLIRKLFTGSKTSIELKNKNHKKIKKAIDAHKQSLQNDYEKIYFLSNKNWLFPGIIISLLVLIVGILNLPTLEGKMVGAFMTIWLSGWSVGVFFLLTRVYQMWKGANSVISYVAAVPVTLFAIPFVAGEVFGAFMFAQAASFSMLMILLLVILVNIAFYHWLKAPTMAGRKILDEIEGFRLYLDVAEKDEMNLHNPPKKTPDLFEIYLPFALALDVEQRWAERFASLFAGMEEQGEHHHPGWYSGHHWHHQHLGDFSSALGGSLSSAISSSSTAPGSSSGSGGGGSSGGGGGGGGGGGW